MQIGMIMISNNPSNLSEQCKDINKLNFSGHTVIKSVLCQHPIQPNEKCLSKFDRYGFDDPVIKGQAVPFLRYRRKAMELVSDCDWFWQFGDDHRFKDSGGEMYSKTFQEYYTDVFNYLAKQPQAGVLSCRGYHGGYAAGYSFEQWPQNGLIMAGHGGILYKNIGIDSIISNEETKLVGALEESLCSFNILSKGYDYVRRFNSPMGTRKTKKVGPENVSYSPDTLERNIKGHINRKFDDPNWHYESKYYPNSIRKSV